METTASIGSTVVPGQKTVQLSALEADDAECISVMESVAAGDLPEKDLATWLRSHISRE